MKKITLILLTCIVLYSCSKQLIPTRIHKTELSSKKCIQPDSILYFSSFYQGEKIDFEYTPLAMISVVNGNDPDPNLFYKLKAEAVKSCANAIVNVKQDISEGIYQQRNYLYNSNDAEYLKYERYDQKIYNGLAVYVPEFTSKVARIDSSFVMKYNIANKVIQESQKKSIEKKEKNYPTVWMGVFITMIIGISILFIKLQ